MFSEIKIGLCFVGVLFAFQAAATALRLNASAMVGSLKPIPRSLRLAGKPCAGVTEGSLKTW